MPQPERSALDALSLDEVKALVVELLAENGRLRDEIARLKGLPPRPSFEPSRMEDGTEGERQPGDKRTAKGIEQPRNGGAKGSRRTADRAIDDEKVLRPKDLPHGSRLKKRQRFVVQDLRLEPHVIRYHRECRRTPDGTLVTAPLPPGIVGHFGPNLVRFVLRWTPASAWMRWKMPCVAMVVQKSSTRIRDRSSRVLHLRRDLLWTT